MTRSLFFFTCLFISLNSYANNISNSHAIFDWAETNYPQYFPATEKTIILDSIDYQSNTYIARYYPSTHAYIGTNNGKVYFYSDDFFNGLQEINSMSKFMDIINPSDEPRINDTGAVKCNNLIQENLACPLTDFPGQDAEYGRDVTDNDSSDGHAGFSFKKLDEQGNTLLADATTWSCVKDNITGLIWEVKTDDRELNNKEWNYTWYDSTGEIKTGLENGGYCYDQENCDTENFIKQVNNNSLCGGTNWRLPTAPELLSTVHFNLSYLVIDENYFVNALTNHYWTSTPKIEGPISATEIVILGKAWYINFGDGKLNYAEKTSRKYVRLVRSE